MGGSGSGEYSRRQKDLAYPGQAVNGKPPQAAARSAPLTACPGYAM